ASLGGGQAIGGLRRSPAGGFLAWTARRALSETPADQVQNPADPPMPTRYSSPLAVLLTVAVCFGATGRAAAQGNNEFRSMPLDQITRWLADSLPPATQLSYVRTDYDDEGTFRINAAIQVLSMRFAGCSLEYQERLTINSEPPDTRTHAANLADLSQ